MKAHYKRLTTCALAVFCALAFTRTTEAAAPDSQFLQLTKALSGPAVSIADDALRGSLAKPKRRGKNKKRRGGIQYKKPNYKIRAPQKSEADRIKEEGGGGLDYLKGKGLSPETPLARKPSPAKEKKKD